MAMDNTILKVVFCLILTDFSSTTRNLCKKVMHHTGCEDWKSAKKICESKNSKLMKPTINNIQQFSSCNKSYENVWVDKFQYLSPWIELYGCYTWKNTSLNLLNELKQKKSRYIPATCERKCQNSDYFGIKTKDCYCINGTFKDAYLINTSSINCSTPCDSEPNLPCGETNAINLYRRVLAVPTVISNGQTSINPILCAELSCETSKISLYKVPCNESLQILCDNGNMFNANTWTNQLNYCKKHNYPYRYTGNSSEFCNITKVSWSGVFRSIINGSLTWFSEKIEQTSCFKLNNVNGSYVIQKTACSNKLAYICIKGDNAETSTQTQEPTTCTENSLTTWITTEQILTSAASTFLPSETTFSSFSSVSDTSHTSNLNVLSENSSAGNAGIIVGAIVPSVVVICGIVFLVIAKKRGLLLSGWLKSKDEEKGESKIKSIDVDLIKSGNVKNDEIKNNFYTETFNQGYEFAKPLDINKSQGYELVKPINNNDDLTGISTTNDYEFAAVINDDDYVYTETKDGEYDTIHNKEKRKIGIDEGNLYSHTRVGLDTDNDYDTTYGAKENDAGDYDHSDFLKQSGRSNTEDNTYDHTNI